MKRNIEPPVWAGPAGRRVLIEVSDWAQQEILTQILRRAHYDTVACDGPEGNNSRCRLVVNGECSGCNGADVVVHALRHADPHNRAVLLAIQARYPGLPLIVEVPGPRAERYPDDFDRCIVIPQPMTSELLLAAISEALTRHVAEP